MIRLMQNPRIPEGINASEEHPLKEFALLFVGVALSLVLLVVMLSVTAQQLAPYIPFRWEQQLTQFDGLKDAPWEDLSTDRDEPIAEPAGGVTAAGSTAADSTAADSTTADAKRATQAAEQTLKQQAQTSLQALVTSLAVSMAIPSEMSFQVHLLDDPAPNAFATLGGHIFVTQGLLAAVSSENALAMVLAHEMAHVKFRHPIQAMSRGALLQLIITMVGGGQGVALNGVLGQTGLLTLLSFNRDMERESDAAAMAGLTQHYGHLVGAEEFFSEVLARHGDAGWRAAFETHPATQERVDAITARIKLMQTNEETSQQLTPLDAGLLVLKAKSEQGISLKHMSRNRRNF